MSTKKAVALAYPPGYPAPFIIAKGRGETAERILDIARENSVCIVKEDITADILSLYEIGEYIPEETYEILAGIFAFIIRTNNGKN